jgi:hypothetical protein
VRPCRVHITGASGSGTSTLARALANRWSVPVFDTDDFFWLPTNPPYAAKRPVAERIALMQALFLPRPAWVLAGSLIGWGDGLVAQFDLVVFLHLDPALRLARLEAREAWRYGPEHLGPGGAGHAAHAAFMAWARGYDDPAFPGRSLHAHRAWLAGLPVPVLSLDSAAPVPALVAQITGAV